MDACRNVVIAAVLSFPLSAFAQDADPANKPYEMLRHAYQKHDVTQAAGAYALDAHYAELYDGATPRVLDGREQIEESFREMFRGFGEPAKVPLDLNFRVTSSKRSSSGRTDAGIYRLTMGTGAARKHTYGRFATQVEAGRFVFDVSTNATEAEFEEAAGDVLLQPDEETLSTFYDALLGEYVGSDGCAEIITRSAVRLFARNTCTQAWRGLNRVSGHQWTAGATTIDSTPIKQYAFSPAENAVTVTQDETVERLARKTPYGTEDLVFIGAQGTKLAGTLYLPTAAAPPRAAVVLVHGSGPQDRHGYASIMAVLADALAREGIVVLVYDKRGVGQSSGDWASASFATLAQDAIAGMNALKGHSAVDPGRVGLAGSSQAGWVIAKAIEAKARPAFTILIGAAGSALTVEEQNIYNTKTRMRCARLSEGAIAKALAQQQLFYDVKRDASKAAMLRDATESLGTVPELRDWLFPATVGARTSSEWFNVLELDFDPLPVWADYDGAAFFLFGDQDDSTPTSLATSRLGQLTRPLRREVVVLRNAQHLGLVSNDMCRGELTNVANFHPDLFSTLHKWAKTVEK